MADLSHLFGTPQAHRRTGPFDRDRSGAQRYKRSIAMREAMQQDLAPDDGVPFYQFVGRRLLELGDVQGAMAVGQAAQQALAQQATAQAEAQQQGFDNQLSAAKFDQNERRLQHELNKPDTVNLATIADPNSPTGRRHVSRRDALGQPAPAATPLVQIGSGGASKLGEQVGLIEQDVASGALTPEVGAAAIEALVNEATQTPGARDAEKAESTQARKANEVSQAATRVSEIAGSLEVGSITDTQARARYKSALSRLATTLAKFRTPGTAEPNKDVIDEIKSTLPESIGAYVAVRRFAGQDPVEAVVEEIMREVGAGGEAGEMAVGETRSVGSVTITRTE